jgi:RimJ/RimL family protein N-acetyltransferase
MAPSELSPRRHSGVAAALQGATAMFALTPRLTLRPGWPEDAPALARAIGHEAVVRNLARAPWPYALGDAESFLSLPRGAHQPCFLICERGGAHRLIGGVELMRDGDAWELGYWLAPDVWGRGYATEAAGAVLNMAPALGIVRVTSRHYHDNPASARVLHKLGFRETGRARVSSLARGGEVESVEMALDLCDPNCPGMRCAA